MTQDLPPLPASIFDGKNVLVRYTADQMHAYARAAIAADRAQRAVPVPPMLSYEKKARLVLDRTYESEPDAWAIVADTEAAVREAFGVRS